MSRYRYYHRASRFSAEQLEESAARRAASISDEQYEQNRQRERERSAFAAQRMQETLLDLFYALRDVDPPMAREARQLAESQLIAENVESQLCDCCKAIDEGMSPCVGCPRS